MSTMDVSSIVSQAYPTEPKQVAPTSSYPSSSRTASAGSSVGSIRRPSSSSSSSTSSQSPSLAHRATRFFGARCSSVLALCALTAAILTGDFLAFGRSKDALSNSLAGALGTFAEALSEGSLSTELTILLCLAALALGVCRPRPTARSQNARSAIRRKAAGKLPSGSSGPMTATSSGLQHDQQPRRNLAVSKLNQSIDAAARAGDATKALQLINEFEKTNGSLEVVSYNLGLRACAKSGKLKQAEQLLRSMEARNVTPTLCSYNTLLDVCAKADNAEACESWLHQMQRRGLEPNVISYATAIYARARRGDVVAAEAWLQRMIEAGIKPDAVSYNSVLHACGVRGNVEKAERWLGEMRAQGLEMSVATFTAVIDACAKSGDVARAEHWLEQMINAGVTPNVVTFSAMIDACARTRNLQRAEYWHGRMVEHNVQPNAHSFSAVINACAKLASEEGAEAAERWLDRSEEAGFASDVVVYSAVIDACGKANDAERALKTFNRMRARGLTPHIVAYAALARPFAYRGDWIKIESIAQLMAADNIVTNEYFLYAQLLAYGVARPRQPDRAEAAFRSALQKGVRSNDHVVGALARAVGRARCGELMQELCGGREVPAHHMRTTRSSNRHRTAAAEGQQ